MTQWRKILFVLFTLLLLSSCSSSVNNDNSDRWYSGYYFDAMINDTHVVEITRKNNNTPYKNYLRASDVLWQLNKPISGPIKIEVKENKNSKSFVGSLDSYALGTKIISLNDDPEGEADYPIRNGYIPPPGNYIFRIKIKGPDNWDRKEVFVRVK